MTYKEKNLISLVIPVLNEGENIYPFYEALLPIIDACSENYNYELIFTDNHSFDDTFEKITELCDRDNRISVIRFARNFGYQKSILTGYLNAVGDAVIQLDCDLQDPPELIPVFLEAWENGNLVVYGIRRTRSENPILHVIRKIFYRLIDYLSDDKLPIDAGDFRLIDRRIVEVLREMDDSQPYLRGTIAAMGFNQVGIPYDRRDRERGSTNFKLKDLFSLALDGILNHSIVPLKIASFFGMVISLVTIMLTIIYVFGKMYFGIAWPAGFTTLAVISLFGISINALFLGIIGEYLGRIYQQVKKKPITIVEKLYGSKRTNG